MHQAGLPHCDVLITTHADALFFNVLAGTFDLPDLVGDDDEALTTLRLRTERQQVTTAKDLENIIPNDQYKDQPESMNMRLGKFLNYNSKTPNPIPGSRCCRRGLIDSGGNTFNSTGVEATSGTVGILPCNICSSARAPAARISSLRRSGSHCQPCQAQGSDRLFQSIRPLRLAGLKMRPLRRRDEIWAAGARADEANIPWRYTNGP